MSIKMLLRLLPAALLVLAASSAYASGSGVSEDLLWNFVWRIMNFAVLVTVIVILARKPIKAGLASRTEQIKEELEELETKREEARREYALMEQRLADAAGEREKILAEFRAQGERELVKIIAAAEETAIRVKDQAAFTIEQETAMAKADLRREVAEMSASLAEDLLKEKITADDQTRLVGEYLDKVSQEIQ